jgi:hypothetical protein
LARRRRVRVAHLVTIIVVGFRRHSAV